MLWIPKSQPGSHKEVVEGGGELAEVSWSCKRKRVNVAGQRQGCGCDIGAMLAGRAPADGAGLAGVNGVALPLPQLLYEAPDSSGLSLQRAARAARAE